jgi:hypothetical protein
MSSVNLSRVVALICLAHAGVLIRNHGWVSYEWWTWACLAGCFLLVEPRREGETTWSRLRRPRQAAILFLAAAGGVFLVLSILKS